jgi:hypothetical protein
VGIPYNPEVALLQDTQVTLRGSLRNFRFSFHDVNSDIVMHALEKHLALELYKALPLCAPQCPHQSFVRLLHNLVVKKLAKGSKRFPWIGSHAANVLH